MESAWPILYEGFGGTLPNIDELRIQITGLLMRFWTFYPFTWCNATATATNPFRMRILRTPEGALQEVKLVESPIPCNGTNLVPSTTGNGNMVQWINPQRRFTLLLI